MSATLMSLTLLLPEDGEDRVLRWLLSKPRWDIEFTQRGVGARGPEVKVASREGARHAFVRRTEFVLLVPAERLDSVVDELADLLSEHEVRWWAQPVTRAGTFPARRLSCFGDIE